MIDREPTRSDWFKSSRSDNANCVEVRFDNDNVLLRDSKYIGDPAAQPIITVPAGSWPAFLNTATGRNSIDATHSIPTIEHDPSGGTTLRAADGTILIYTPNEWSAFTAGVHAGEFAAA